MIAIPPGWNARDCRQFVALTLLAAGNIPLTVSFVIAQLNVWQDPGNARAERLGAYAAILIALDLFGVSAILGRRLFKLKFGDKEVELAGDEAERVLARGDAA